MHQQIIDWLKSIRAIRPDIFLNRKVLECGSLDINGTPRPLFVGCEYIGLDWRAGPGVDVISLMHEYRKPDEFDVIISTETLEHDPYWVVSIWNMVDCLRVHGDMLLTFGGIDRAKHEAAVSPTTGYYRGLASWEVYRHMATLFDTVHIWDDGNDVYIWLEGKK